jgi:peptidoglycan/xylan/chitin deacetylase (PgdA/CDA1 family)
MSETPGIRKASAGRGVVRLSKLAVSLIVFAFDRAFFQICKLLRKDMSGRCVVLSYHSVPGNYVERFSSQMRLARELAHPGDLRNPGTRPKGKVWLGITFDDAMESFYRNAVPVLKELDVPATVFVVADALGNRPVWGKVYYLPDERVMSAQQLLSLPESIAVGSHTLTHANLLTSSPEVAWKEIAGSRRKLETLLQRSVDFFSFPFGDFNESLVRQCKEAGYVKVFTTEPTCISIADASRTFVVGRVSVDPWDWQLEFRLKIMGAYRWQAVTHSALSSLARLLSAWKLSFRKETIQKVEERRAPE